MSNILSIDKTEFKGTEYSTYGLRIYDGYDKDYNNNLEKEEFDNLIDDNDILELAKELFPDFLDDLDAYSGIEINGYSLDIKSLEEL